jgi:predicted GIY-YIG superfamily endonuclease
LNDVNNDLSVACSRGQKRASKPAWNVYLLRCRDGSLYTGITNDLPKRLKAHAAGKASRYTRSRLPVRLVYQEPQASKSSALKREAAIKKLPRPQKLKLLAKPKKRSSGRRT